MSYALVCLSFDGDCVVEKRDFEKVEDAWEHSENMGSRWFFYPFHFVVSESLKTVIDTPCDLEFFKGKRLATVARFFEKCAKFDRCQNVDADTFLYWLIREWKENYD